MNERIRELRASAFAYATVSSTDYFEDKKDFNEKFDEKFAELIVKECAKVAYECGPTVVYGSERQFNPITYTGNQILMHFGVKE
jgi:hypothetical protein